MQHSDNITLRCVALRCIFYSCFVFLHPPQTIFRVYIESLWYPGRHLNLINLQQNMKLGNLNGSERDELTLADADAAAPASSPAAGANPSGQKVLDGSGLSVPDVMEAPRFITARHVAAVFERSGFDPRRGQEVFRILCGAAAKLKGEEDDSYRKSYKDLKEAVGEAGPPQPDSPAESSGQMKGSEPMPNAALVAALRGSELLETRPSMDTSADGSSSAPAGATVGSAPASGQSGSSSLSNMKMDIKDFIR